MRWPVVAAVVGFACGGDPGAPDAPRPDAVHPDALPVGVPRFDEGPHRGRIEVISADGVYTADELQAMFAAEPTRTRLVFYARVAVFHWQVETQRDGACRLLELVPQECTACPGLCVGPQVCEPYPEYASAGRLRFRGLLGGDRELSPSPAWYASQGPLGALFADGTPITVVADGDAVPAFTVGAAGVAPLATAIPADGLPLPAGADAVVTWTPASPEDPDVRVRLVVNANNHGHGLPYAAVIECDSADVGALAIPRAMIDAFPPTMAWGACVGSDCPTSTLTRYRQTTISVDGAPVDLVIGARHHFWALHP